MDYKSLFFCLFVMIGQGYAQQQKALVIPAKKAYAEPFELKQEMVGCGFR